MSLDVKIRLIARDIDFCCRCKRQIRSYLLLSFHIQVAAVCAYAHCAAINHLGPDVHLMLLDWEMPCMDGREVLSAAQSRGVNLKRVIITSAHSATELHEVFQQDDCLAVIEKSEPEQHAAFMMILDSIMRR